MAHWAAGDVAIFSAQTLQPVRRVHQGHMVFCTAVAFASTEEGLLSVSGDCSMRTTPTRRAGNTQSLVILLAILVLMLAILTGFISSRRTR